MRAFALVLILAACAPPDDLPPQLREAAQSDAPFPELQPIAPLLDAAAAPGRVTDRTGADLSARASGLRGRAGTGQSPSRAAAGPQLSAQAGNLRDRAAALRPPVVDPALRDRMREGAGDAALR
ncbi:hypothetical protein EU805_07710 [Salipiger sp. IMCC34102]|uniref:hypothetical protein n=1 Tax=Salipiger sp. IMCC34102 TaxID=2510647 RepID=UPI00101CC40A|nr:hypothetical protein [Salipiger sp. IMCC34102]RYH03586.1 hypothetical protein EU805_07710 [Salipiger sp. IMCC34102]